MELIYTDGRDKRFASLCEELDEHLNFVSGGEKQRKRYIQYNTLENIHDVVMVVEHEQAVACGSFKEYDPDIAEIKRVFTKEGYRKRGYSQSIMAALEKRALDKGYKKLVLETGRLFQDAIRMYTAYGFRVIENYGPYKNMIESVCMEKELISKKE